MRRDFLEDEEEELAAAARRAKEPVDDRGFAPLSVGVMAAFAVAKAAASIAPECESPIEATFGARLSLAIEEWNKSEDPKLLLVPQYPLAGKRYDFAIVAAAKLICAIECDGKDFHSSPAQQANDAAKNAMIWAKGAEIFRFTGSQIFRRDNECVDAVMRYINGKFA